MHLMILRTLPSSIHIPIDLGVFDDSREVIVIEQNLQGSKI